MKLLDLFCGAGGAAMGYHRAGFDEIVGVDIAPQPNYPFEFFQGDALEFLAEHGKEFGAIHASPPCQAYSVMRNLPWFKDREYPALILPTLTALKALDVPYMLENVMGAKKGSVNLKKRALEDHGLEAGWLCGGMFGLPFYRHRLVASNVLWLVPFHPKHFTEKNDAGRTFIDASGRKRLNDPKLSLPTEQSGLGNGAQREGAGVGHAKGWRLAAAAMGIDWMRREELTQAIPPAYTEYLGKFLLDAAS